MKKTEAMIKREERSYTNIQSLDNAEMQLIYKEFR